MDLDYDDVDNVVLQQYNNEHELEKLNIRQMRGVMRYHNIPYLDDNGNILPPFRTNNDILIRRRAPYINAILMHFQQQQQPQNNDDNEDDDEIIDGETFYIFDCEQDVTLTEESILLIPQFEQHLNRSQVNDTFVDCDEKQSISEMKTESTFKEFEGRLIGCNGDCGSKLSKLIDSIAYHHDKVM